MKATNNGLVTHLSPSRSQELDDESRHASRDECPCRECRHARRREFGTLPFDAPSLTLREIWDRAPFWLRLVLIWVTTATACLLAAVAIDQTLAFVVGIE